MSGRNKHEGKKYKQIYTSGIKNEKQENGMKTEKSKDKEQVVK
jgi:hypothetical protein